jgi:hypothetical protein
MKTYVYLEGEERIEMKVNISEETTVHKGNACCYMRYPVLITVMNQLNFSGRRK